jgi:hypothetical protein
VRDWPPKRTQKRQFWPLKKKTEALRFYATMAAISSNGLIFASNQQFAIGRRWGFASGACLSFMVYEGLWS